MHECIRATPRWGGETVLQVGLHACLSAAFVRCSQQQPTTMAAAERIRTRAPAPSHVHANILNIHAVCVCVCCALVHTLWARGRLGRPAGALLSGRQRTHRTGCSRHSHPRGHRRSGTMTPLAGGLAAVFHRVPTYIVCVFSRTCVVCSFAHTCAVYRQTPSTRRGRSRQKHPHISRLCCCCIAGVFKQI